MRTGGASRCGKWEMGNGNWELGIGNFGGGLLEAFVSDAGAHFTITRSAFRAEARWGGRGL